MQCTSNFNDIPEPFCRYNNVNLTILDPFQRQIQDFPKGGGAWDVAGMDISYLEIS